MKTNKLSKNALFLQHVKPRMAQSTWNDYYNRGSRYAEMVAGGEFNGYLTR